MYMFVLNCKTYLNPNSFSDLTHLRIHYFQHTIIYWNLLINLKLYTGLVLTKGETYIITKQLKKTFKWLYF